MEREVTVGNVVHRQDMYDWRARDCVRRARRSMTGIAWIADVMCAFQSGKLEATVPYLLPKAPMRLSSFKR